MESEPIKCPGTSVRTLKWAPLRGSPDSSLRHLIYDAQSTFQILKIESFGRISWFFPTRFFLDEEKDCHKAVHFCGPEGPPDLRFTLLRQSFALMEGRIMRGINLISAINVSRTKEGGDLRILTQKPQQKWGLNLHMST